MCPGLHLSLPPSLWELGSEGRTTATPPPQMAAKIPKPTHSAPEMCVLLNARVRTGRLRLMFMKNTRKIGCGGQGAIKLGYLLEGGGPWGAQQPVSPRTRLCSQGQDPGRVSCGHPIHPRALPLSSRQAAAVWCQVSTRLSTDEHGTAPLRLSRTQTEDASFFLRRDKKAQKCKSLPFTTKRVC